MNRPPEFPSASASDPPRPGAGLGPVGDLIGGQWPVQAADRIESVVGAVRQKATGPAMVASRALVYGIVGIVFVTIVAVLGLIATLRALEDRKSVV